MKHKQHPSTIVIDSIINKNKNHIIILAKNSIVQIGKINIKVMLLKKN